LLTGAVSVCPQGHCTVGAIDHVVLTQAQAMAEPWATAFWRAVTWFGSLYVLAPLAVLIMVLPIAATTVRERSLVLIALLSTTAIAQLIKWSVDRPRPELFPPLAAVPADPSYPSGHAMQATAFALALLMMPGLRCGKLAVLAVLTLALLVAASRIALQVHFPTDVVFGVTAAACWVTALRLLLISQDGQR
jgi:membrane-associated phospholipid phosphatase